MEFPLHSILYKIIKCLMMSELEIVYLSLFLEQYGWDFNDIKKSISKMGKSENFPVYEISLDENLLCIAIFVKVFILKIQKKIFIKNFI